MLIAIVLEPVFDAISQMPPFVRSLLVVFLIAATLVVLAKTGVLMPRHFRLRAKGLDLLLAGDPVGAEKCFRAALDLGAGVPRSDRVRLLVCLCDALMDQRRYPEAMPYLKTALEIGDPTGSGQGSMCDLLLAMKTEPEKAIEMADEALRLITGGVQNQPFGTGWGIVHGNLYEAKSWARKTRALLLLDRQTEARQALGRAMKILESSKDLIAHTMPETSLLGTLILGDRSRNMKNLNIANAHWEIGLALEALRDKSKAAEQFQIVRDTDRMGKYRRLAQEKLLQLGFNTQ